MRGVPAAVRPTAVLGLTCFVLTGLTGLFAATPLVAAPLPPEAVELRDRGLAELENEKPDAAVPHYEALTELLPREPLGWANLAIARLRKQENDAAKAAISKALELAPGRADLLAIEGDVLQWSGDLEGALDRYRAAMDADPDDLEILWAAVQQARTLQGDEEADRVARQALFRLSRLRPENLLVLLQLGHGAIANGNRSVATTVFGRVGELLWQADPVAEKAFAMVREALEGDDLAAARIPAVRLENVLKVTPMYRESLRELKTGIQGIPIHRFSTGEPPSLAAAEPATIAFELRTLDTAPTAGRALVVTDLDADEQPEIARVRAPGADGAPATLETWRPGDEARRSSVAMPGSADVLLDVDLDNDGTTELVSFGAAGPGRTWRPAAGGLAPDGELPQPSPVAGAVAIDFDIEGDLDLALAGASPHLLRNPGTGAFDDVTDRSWPGELPADTRAVAASDLDRDGDLDLVFGSASGWTWLDNLRQGRFVDRTADAGLADGPDLRAVVAADLDGDARPDLIGAGPDGVVVRRNAGGGTFEAPETVSVLPAGDWRDLRVFDADNDGRQDLVVVGTPGVGIALARDAGWAALPVAGTEGLDLATVEAADLDHDGDLDVAVAGASGLHVLTNQGGNANAWLQVRLRGLTEGNSKNNVRGEGSLVEVRDGATVQFREARGDVVHFGLGSEEEADVLRVVWTNGVPQNRLGVAGSQRVVEEQLLKGSCPFLYAWDGEGFRFVTDLLWGAPIGLPVAEGVYAGADPGEIVRIDGLVPDAGSYRLRVTEELWEAAFFDVLRLWVVDHPADVEVASNLRIVPGAPPAPERVLGTRELRPVARAVDGRGRDATERVRHRDEVYADGYEESPYQGVAAAPWTFELELGEAPDGPVRLVLDGWIFPADASLNLAVDQRGGPAPIPPRLEVETDAGWEVLVANAGFPAGKTKTMVLDLPPLPEGAHRLRIVTGQWLHWDRIAWSVAPADDAPTIVARLDPTTADLRFRGFSAPTRQAPNGPHEFDYARTSTASPWLPFPGRYTRYGDVRPLLAELDDLSVVLAAGDEIDLVFDATDLPPAMPGFVRTLFLESHGWDKDADRNTGAGTRVEPLPFHAMSRYPYAAPEAFPDTEAHREYLRAWQTRVVEPGAPVSGEERAP